MKVSEIKKELEDIDDDLECYVVADHGQTFIQAGGAGEMYIHKDQKDDYYVDALSIEDIELDELLEEYIKICVISD